MNKIGYAWVSTRETKDEKLDLQRTALQEAWCTTIYEDQTGGIRARRSGLDQAIADLDPGACLVVWRLDRLGNSVAHLGKVLRLIQAKGAGFISITEAIDTTVAGGHLVFHMMTALAEFERALIVERTQAGQATAKARGTKLGRRKSLTPEQIAHGRALLLAGATGHAVAKTLGVSRATLYRAMT